MNSFSDVRLMNISEHFLYHLTGIGKASSVKGEDGILDIQTNITLETTWRGMEDLVSKGLVRSIGIR